MYMYMYECDRKGGREGESGRERKRKALAYVGLLVVSKLTLQYENETVFLTEMLCSVCFTHEARSALNWLQTNSCLPSFLITVFSFFLDRVMRKKPLLVT